MSCKQSVRTFPLLVGILALFLLPLSADLQSQPKAPPMPESGPGGKSYSHADVSLSSAYWAEGYEGDNAYRYYIYEPIKPKISHAPVVLFLHGWLAFNPNDYKYWINHLVLKGHVVVWVQYDAFDPIRTVNDRAQIAWIDALKRLSDPSNGHTRPSTGSDGSIRTAIVGHSLGGYMGVVLAAKSTRWWNRFPEPEAVVAIQPAGRGIVAGSNLSLIDPDTKLVVVVAEQDHIACAATAKTIWDSVPQIPDANRDLLLVRTDRHGEPQQLANHYFPNNNGFRDTALADARDFYVTFKLTAAALNCAFNNRECSYALGNGSAEQLFMGSWDDGTRITPMRWVADSSSLPTRCIRP